MTPAFALLGAATAPGSKVNEDAWGVWPDPGRPRAAWVLDGVTGINDRPLLPGPSDAAWFVAQVQEALPALLSSRPDQPVAELIEALAKELERRQSACWLDPRGADGRETPAASFAMVRWLDDTIEIARLGDCLVLLEAADGTVKVMEHPVLERIEADTRRAVLDLRAAGVTEPKELFARMMPQLLAQRARRNRPDGYGVLAGEPACVSMLHVDRVPAAALRHVLLASDGYYRLVDHYDAMTDAGLVRRTRDEGADVLLKQLRVIEAEDPLAAVYPRLKISDDATALLLGMGKNQR
jgi:Protein phosphatase 2C